MIAFLNAVIKGIGLLVSSLLSLLPSSPFTWNLSALSDIWGVANYFIPFQAMATVLGAYVLAVAGWYVVRWALRLVRYIS